MFTPDAMVKVSNEVVKAGKQTSAVQDLITISITL